LPVVTGLFLSPTPALAQLLSKWGHPVISFGQQPYDAVSTGQGNYPGSNGFVPGYGYYPGPFPSHYPWYDGPAPHRSAVAVPGPAFPTDAGLPSLEVQGPPPVARQAVPASAALLQVHVPADATIRFSGQPTSQRGAWRQFVTPPLEGGRALVYELQVRWHDHGQVVERTRLVQVAPGDVLTFDFLVEAQAERLPPR
jgi:uncharacterized protein (TIGR03000 family)